MYKDTVSRILDRLQSDSVFNQSEKSEKIDSPHTNHFENCTFNFNGDIHVNFGLDPYDPELYSEDSVPLFRQIRKKAVRDRDFKTVAYCDSMILELEGSEVRES